MEGEKSFPFPQPLQDLLEGVSPTLMEKHILAHFIWPMLTKMNMW